MSATPRRRSSSTRLLSTALSVLLLGGCSTFERDWKTLAEGGALEGTTVVEDVDSMTGRWSGTWESGNGHGGALRCILRTDEEGILHADYKAVYGNFLTFEYSVPMTVEVDGATCRFTGAANLGFLAGGKYTYEGTVEGDVFHSTYDSRVYKGTFDMKRVPVGVLDFEPALDDAEEPAEDSNRADEGL